MDMIASTVAKAMSALGGPAGRWLNLRKASKIALAIQNLSDSATAVGRGKNDALWQILKVEADLDPQSLSAAHAAIGGPLMESFAEMCVVEAILNTRQNDRARDAIRRGMATVLAVETGIKAEVRTDIARIIDAHYFEAARALFIKLSRTNPEYASIVQRAARANRDTLRISSVEALNKRSEHVGRLEPVDWASITQRVVSYAESLVAELSSLSIPTPTKEFQVAFDDAFVSTGLVSVEDNESAVPSGRSLGRQETDDLLHALAERRRVILFGDPGSGKSTNVQSAMLDLARSAMGGTLEAVPFRVTLRNMARTDSEAVLPSVVDFLLANLRDEYDSGLSINEVRYLLHSGRAVLFLDGLDEVLDIKLRRELVRRIAGVVNAFPASGFVVTSRVTGYDEAPLQDGLLYRALRTRAFRPREVEDYAEWFFRNHGMGRYRKELGVAGFMRQTEPIADIRSNPLMLGVLCGLYASGRSVPADRTEVYRDCARMLFEQWDQLKATYTTVVDHEVAERAIRKLAHQVLISGREDVQLATLHEFLAATYETELGCDPLTADRKSTQTIALWRGRLWILTFDGRRNGEDWYRFSHRTFLEFFAAEHLAYTVTDGAELFKSLTEWIVKRTAVPFVQLSAQLTSRRRAVDGEMFLNAALRYVEADELDEVDRLGCAILLAEVLPSLRVPNSKARSAAIGRILKVIAGWLPRTPDLSRFYSSPYAYADFRYLSRSESSISLEIYQSESLHDDDVGEGADWSEEELAVDYGRVAQVVLGLDSGRPVDDGSLAGPLDDAIEQLRSELPPRVVTRFALLLRAIPDIEGANLYSDWWRDHLRLTADELLARASNASPEVDVDDKWVVIQLCSLGLLGMPVAAKALEFSDLFAGGSPYPVTRTAVDGTPAHRIVEMILFGGPGDTDELAGIVLLKPGRQIEMESLFVHGALGRIERAASMSPHGAVCVALLLHFLEAAGDELFVGDALRSLSASEPSHAFAQAVRVLLRDDGDYEAWSEAEDLAHSLGMPRERFQELLRRQ